MRWGGCLATPPSGSSPWPLVWLSERATLWPLCVDLFVFVATLAAVADRRQGRPTAYAWMLAVLSSAATVAGNVTPAGPSHLAQAIHACRQ